MTGRVGPRSSYRLNDRSYVALAATHHTTSRHDIFEHAFLNVVGLLDPDRTVLYRDDRTVPLYGYRHHWKKTATAI